MTAAERFARMTRYDEWSHLLSLGNVFLACGVALAIVAGVGFYSGKSKGEAIGRNAANALMLAQLADSSKAIEARMSRRADSLNVARVTAQAARDIYLPTRAKVRIVSDTVVRVDTQLVAVPREIVRVIARADTVIKADSVAIDLLTVQLRDMTKDRDVWQHRALLDEDALKQIHPSRLGFRSGMTVGALAVVGLVVLTR